MILQFGTSRFLQAHVDLFAQQARDSGQASKDIVIVQTTRDTSRSGRLKAFADPSGFDVIVRGMRAGTVTEATHRVTSVVNGLNASADWPVIVMIAKRQMTHIVSNTAETGYEIAEQDRALESLDANTAPTSFPAILAALLYKRWRTGGEGVTVLPCELLRDNAAVLHRIVADFSAHVGAEPGFLDWLNNDCRWASTLVDRIVSSPLEPAGAVAEPYALWAVQSVPGLTMPFEHPDVIVTDDLDRFERLKVHILNLGHSWLAEIWSKDQADPERTVRDMMADEHAAGSLAAIYRDEVIPGFAAQDLEAEALAYVDATTERFRNPFLDHLLADIHNGHPMKVSKRVGGFLEWIDAGTRRVPEMPRLRAFANIYARSSF